MTDNYLGDGDQVIVLDSDRKMTYTNQTNSSQKYQNHKSGSPSSNMGNNSQLDKGNYDLSNAAHPIACIATVFFKGFALFFYLFLSAMVPSVLTFIFVLVLSALDFWTVKNVTGRLLVGLRWWNQYNEKGEQVWRFQSFDKDFVGNPVDQAFFWTGQIASTLVWGFFLFIKILSLNIFWGILTAISFSLSILNLYGFYKCRGDYMSKLKSLKNSSFRNLAGKIFI